MSEENLEQSLGAAGEALEFLVASLENAGFGDNAPAYTKMAEVLVGQRSWAIQNGVGQFDADFRKVGGLGRRLHELVDPYGKMAKTLTVLLEVAEQPAAQPAQSPEQPVDGPEAAVLAAMGEMAISMTAISSRCGLPTRQVRALLQKLVVAGKVIERRAGSRTRFEIAELDR